MPPGSTTKPGIPVARKPNIRFWESSTKVVPGAEAIAAVTSIVPKPAGPLSKASGGVLLPAWAK